MIDLLVSKTLHATWSLSQCLQTVYIFELYF